MARTVLYFRRTELHYIIDLLADKDHIRVLDYGCNTGYLLRMIKERYPRKAFALCGADINRAALEYARNRHEDCEFFHIDEDFIEREVFDVVIVSHVLEHVHERERFVANLRKLLDKNGTLIIAIPQERIRGDSTIVQFLYNVVRGRVENPHVVNLSYHDLNALLAPHGLQIRKHAYTHLLYPFKSNERRVDSWSLVTEIQSHQEKGQRDYEEDAPGRREAEVGVPA